MLSIISVQSTSWRRIICWRLCIAKVTISPRLFAQALHCNGWRETLSKLFIMSWHSLCKCIGNITTVLLYFTCIIWIEWNCIFIDHTICYEVPWELNAWLCLAVSLKEVTQYSSKLLYRSVPYQAWVKCLNNEENIFWVLLYNFFWAINNLSVTFLSSIPCFINVLGALSEPVMVWLEHNWWQAWSQD